MRKKPDQNTLVGLLSLAADRQLALRLARGGAAAGRRGRERIEEPVDDLEDGALLGGGELGEALDAPGDLGAGRVAERASRQSRGYLRLQDWQREADCGAPSGKSESISPAAERT